MASDIRIRIGAVSATLAINGSDQQTADALRRYARSLGIPINGTAQENLIAILEHWRDEVRRVSKQVQVAEADAVSHAANVAQAESDNPL